MQSQPPPLDHLAAANSTSDKEEPLPSDQPPDANQEWLLYQQRAAQQLAGDFRPSPDDTRRIPPQPLDEAQLNVLHAASQIQSSPEAGTLVTDYVGAVPHAPFSIPASAPIVPIETELPQPVAITDHVLPWAKRLAFALLGAFLGTYLYSTGDHWPYLSELMPNLTTIVASLFLAFLMRKRSNYAKYGAIAVTMSLLLTLPLLMGQTYYRQAADFLQDPVLHNPKAPSDTVNELLSFITRANNIYLFFISTGIGMALLAALAVLKSLRRGAALIGLVFIAATVAIAMLPYNSGSLASFLLYVMPIVILLLYGMSGRRHGNESSPDLER